MLALPLVCALALAASTADTEERTVTKASVYLVKSPSFLAPRASTVALHRGDKVRLSGERQGAWYRVTFLPAKQKKPVSGFIHLSYLSDRPSAFKVEQGEVDGKGLVSGHYNLAVPGLREEIASEREQKNKDAAKGYRIVERYMLVRPDAKSAGLPRDPISLAAFLAKGRLQEPVPPAEEQPAEETATAPVKAAEPAASAPAAAPASPVSAPAVAPAPTPAAPSTDQTPASEPGEWEAP